MDKKESGFCRIVVARVYVADVAAPGLIITNMSGDIQLMKIIGELCIVHTELNEAIEQKKEQDEENDRPDKGFQNYTSNLLQHI